jgi:AcrR family transcriptional regulator
MYHYADMSWDTTGRVEQKRRTHAALVSAAADLMSEGTVPTIPEAAKRSGISRATAYRYFASNDALAIEAALEAALAHRLPFETQVGRPEENVDHLVTEVFTLVADHEPQFRQMLRALLDPTAPPTRAGRRLAWINNALDSLELDDKQRERLTAGLALFTGAESFIVLKDVCGLDHQAALEVTRWAAYALLTAATQHDAPGARRKPATARRNRPGRR